ncbi:MAG: SoxR reducing system RseC family protein [Acidaminococcaceae bacterium]
MAEIKGWILEQKGERARIKIDQEKSTAPHLPKILDCWNPTNAKPGDKVEIEMRAFDKKKAKMIIYGLPVFSLMAGAAFGNSVAIFFGWQKLWAIVGGMAIWLFMGMSYVNTFRRDAVREGEQPVVVAITYE